MKVEKLQASLTPLRSMEDKEIWWLTSSILQRPISNTIDWFAKGCILLFLKKGELRIIKNYKDITTVSNLKSSMSKKSRSNTTVCRFFQSIWFHTQKSRWVCGWICWRYTFGPFQLDGRFVYDTQYLARSRSPVGENLVGGTGKGCGRNRHRDLYINSSYQFPVRVS